MPPRDRAYDLLVEVTRGTEIESAHSGSVIVLKPLQAVAMVRLGLSLPSPLLALAAASHSGEEVHLDAVRAMLATVGLTESSLENAPGLPYEDDQLHTDLGAGGEPSRIVANCSGKHAAMLATCVVNGWPTHGCCGLHHPLAAGILAECAELAGGQLGFIGIDGCGAPAPQLSLRALGLAVDDSHLQPELVLSGNRVVGEVRPSLWLTEQLRQI